MKKQLRFKFIRLSIYQNLQCLPILDIFKKDDKTQIFFKKREYLKVFRLACIFKRKGFVYFILLHQEAIFKIIEKAQNRKKVSTKRAYFSRVKRTFQEFLFKLYQHLRSNNKFKQSMEYKTIPQMNRQLDQLNQFFTNRTQHFKTKISQHEGKFTHDDLDGFENLVEEIKRDALTKISNFFSEKFSDRSAIYETQISSYTSDGNSVKDDLDKFREQLIAATFAMKEEQNRKQALMEFFSEKFRKNQILKKSFKLMRENKLKRKEERILDEKMDLLYRKNLLKKSFFPWRYLTYKDGFGNTVQKQAENDMINIHEQYSNIIEILKTKITETDQIIRVKKAAKGQFAYSLSKNLLKTISNLSLQVMNLNQMSLRDGEWAQESTERFMNEVDSVIQGKLMKVREYKRELIGREGQEDQGQKKKKHISFA